MPAYAVIGGQWGDEGKGKIVDYCAKDRRVLNPELKSRKPTAVDVVVRFNGGPNAGHRVQNPQGEFTLHNVPSGIVIPEVGINIIGPGCAVDIFKLAEELETTSKILGASMDDLLDRLIISPKAHLIFGSHIAEDIAREILRKNNEIGTTKSGMGPVFSDKAHRDGLRVGELLDEKGFLKKFSEMWTAKRKLINDLYLPQIMDVTRQDRDYLSGKIILAFQNGHEKDAFNKVCNRLSSLIEKLRSRIQNTEYLLYEANTQGKHILFEGAQGFLLDVDHGTYPYTASSACGIWAAYNCGIPARAFVKRIGVFKFPYMTRVGEGPFPSEMIGEDEEVAEHIRAVANEYGATTGRPRRIGWFDYVAANYSIMMNDFTHLVLTRADVFDEENAIKVGIGYNCVHNTVGAGKEMPQVSDLYCQDFNHVIQNGKVCAAFELRKSWAGRGKIHGVRRFENLPQEAQALCREVEERTGVPLLLVSTSPKRNETIVVPSR